MFGLGPATKIYINLDAMDMRQGFYGLYGLVRDQLGQDRLSGHLFLFTKRMANVHGHVNASERLDLQLRIEVYRTLSDLRHIIRSGH